VFPDKFYLCSFTESMLSLTEHDDKQVSSLDSFLHNLVLNSHLILVLCASSVPKIKLQIGVIAFSPTRIHGLRLSPSSLESFLQFDDN